MSHSSTSTPDMHTRTPYSFLTRALPLLLLTAPSALAATCTWQGGTGTWETASAWSCGAVPGASDDVVVNGGTITITAAAGVRDLTFSNGILDGPGDLTIGGALAWEAGTMSGTGTTTVSGVTTFSGATSKNIGRRVVLQGPATWANGTLGMRDGGELINESVFTDNYVGSHSIARTGTISAEPLVVNRGTWLIASGGTNTNVDFSNEGSLAISGAGFDVNSPGRFANTASGAISGEALLDVSSGPVVSIDGRTMPGGAVVGQFPVRGPFPMASGHVLDVDLTGAGASGYDQLATEDGDVTVAGRLLVRVASASVVGGEFPILTHTGSGSVTGCYGPDDIDVVQPDGVTPAPYVVTVTCTAEGITLGVAPATAGEERPSPEASALAVVGANPFARRTEFAFTAATTGPARVEAFDALGRRVAVLYDGWAEAGRSLRLAFEADALAPGRYVVRASGGSSQAVTRVQ